MEKSQTLFVDPIANMFFNLNNSNNHSINAKKSNPEKDKLRKENNLQKKIITSSNNDKSKMNNKQYLLPSIKNNSSNEKTKKTYDNKKDVIIKGNNN